MRTIVSMLGLVTALALVAPALQPAPAHAADGQTTVTTDNWRMIAAVVKKLWLEAYLLVDRLLDGSRDGGCSCSGSTCPCCGGGGGGTGGGTGGGGTGGGGTPPGYTP